MEFLSCWNFNLEAMAWEITFEWQYIFILVFFVLISKSMTSHSWRSFQEWKKGYGAIPRYPQLDPIMGLDMAFTMATAAKNHTFLQWLCNLHVTGKAKTITFNFFGKRFVHTTEPENMKALFATSVWKDFGVGPLRRNNHATMPFADKGVGTVDGPEWEFSRTIIKPYFARESYTNTERLEKYTDNLLSLIPQDGSTFDMQILMQRWFLDTSTEFMFGESTNSLLHPERDQIAWAMAEILRGLRFRLMMVRLLWLFKHKAWLDAIGIVHTFIDRHIDKAYADLAKKNAPAEGANSENKSTTAIQENYARTDLLWSMLPHFGGDREHLRSEMLILFAPNNDTTSILISNAFWSLARHPAVYAKVREEVLSHGLEADLTYERLRSMTYLGAVLNEVHRLFPVNITQTRMCVRDSTLPLGGGKDRTSPILLKKGDVVRVNKLGMFRDKDLWGEDADNFKPERMLGKSPSWSFMPFSGGPRRCPAQPSVTTEASYCIARFARRFKAIESRDNNPYTPLIRVQPVHMNGVKIAAMAA
ncbi:cytochrome P450 [Rhexocercosporidium sp. MPI-PUGE-AT-0058]|nr:cytochrome P450 [Rhexocercosporidium sp. MPI-PUGE-AT-0058]